MRDESAQLADVEASALENTLPFSRRDSTRMQWPKDLHEPHDIAMEKDAYYIYI